MISQKHRSNLLIDRLWVSSLSKLGLIEMRWKLFIEFCLTVSILCLLAGDLFLPQPYRGNTQQLKANLGHFITSLLPRRTIINLDSQTKLAV